MKYMPKIDIPDIGYSSDEVKIHNIIYLLNQMDYGVGTARDTVSVIEKQGIDKFDFDYPYGSFEEYKKHVLAGEFDVKTKTMTFKRREESQKAVEDGRLHVQVDHFV